MRKLSVNSFVTLDGVMQAPGGPEEDPSVTFEAQQEAWLDAGQLLDRKWGKIFG